MKPNVRQQEVIDHEAGPLCIFAGPGAGKTGTLTKRVVSLVERGVSAEKILAVTFTNKAAAELRERIAHVVGKSTTKKLWVGTFHSTCVRLLRLHPAVAHRTAKFVIYDQDDLKHVLRPLLADAEESAKSMGIELPPDLVKIDDILSRISYLKGKGKRPQDLLADAVHDRLPDGADDDAREDLKEMSRLRAEIANDSSQRWFVDLWLAHERRMEVLDALDFDDLLIYGMLLVEDRSGVGERLRAMFEHVLVDEYQDTNRTQFRLVSALASNRNLCVVGDDHQSIYSWRGAEVEFIRRFTKYYPDATVIKLDQNYRSTKAIVAVGRAIADAATDCEPKALWTDNVQGLPVELRVLADEREEATYVAEQIEAALFEGQTKSAFAVVYRMHTQSRPIENELRVRNIRYKIAGGHKFFDRAEIKNAISYLRLARKRGSDADMTRILDAPPCGVGPGTMKVVRRVARARGISLHEALAAAADLPETKYKTRASMLELHQRIDSVAGALVERSSDGAVRAKSVEEAVKSVLGASGYMQHLRNQLVAYSDPSDGNKVKADEVKSRVDNLNEFLTDAARWRLRQEQRGDEATLESYLERIALLSAEDDDRTDDAVLLTTSHAVKGKEFDVVFVVGVEENLMPAFPGKKTAQEIMEERRVFYVAITRARKRLVMTRASQRWYQGKSERNPSSRFLGEIPKELLARPDRAADLAAASDCGGELALQQ